MSKENYDYVSAIIEYESGLMPYDETIELFQYLIDTGIVWNLQGSYQRLAKYLIENGECTI